MNVQTAKTARPISGHNKKLSGVARPPFASPDNAVGRGATFFPFVGFSLSLRDIWALHIENDDITPCTRPLVFEMCQLFAYPSVTGFNRRSVTYEMKNRAACVGAL